MRRIAVGRKRMGTGCSCKVLLYGQTESSGGGKRSASDRAAQADLATFGEFLNVRAAGVRDGVTKEPIHRNGDG